MKRFFASLLGGAAKEVLKGSNQYEEPGWKSGKPEELMLLVNDNYLTPQFMKFAKPELQAEIKKELFKFSFNFRIWVLFLFFFDASSLQGFFGEVTNISVFIGS